MHIPLSLPMFALTGPYHQAVGALCLFLGWDPGEDHLRGNLVTACVEGFHLHHNELPALL